MKSTSILSSTPLNAAGSNRRYFRESLADESTRIYVEGTSQTENHAFITLARHFSKKGLNTPHIIDVTDNEMSYRQEDLGSLSLFDFISHGRETGTFQPEEIRMIEKTIRHLAHIQIEGAQDLDWSVCYPVAEMDKRSILWDLNYWKYCYLKGTGIEIDECQLENDFETLATLLMSEKRDVFMYRDCQSRNVMLVEREDELEPYFIDFQGGRKGPMAYDIASFLWQAKANIPQTLRDTLIEAYLDEVAQIYQPTGQAFDKQHFRETLPYWVLFRNLQVLGAYGYRGFFERKAHFIESIPFAKRNLSELFSLHRELCEACPYIAQVATRDFPTLTPTIDHSPSKELVVTIYSFSYKKGIPEDPSGHGGGYVFDCRSTHNPGKYEQYKHLTGLDQEVIKFLEEDGEILRFLEHTDSLIRHHVERYKERGFTHLQIAFGCTGGQHRSVYSAEHTARLIHNELGVKVHLIHREQQIDKML